MRLKYFILILATITFLSLTYAWQQIEIIKLAYQENQKDKVFKELLDINHSLRYNLASLKSSSNLGRKLFADNTKYEIPKQTQIKILTLPSEKKETFCAQDVFIKEGILSVFKAMDAWPISLAKSYFSKQAQAEDSINKEVAEEFLKTTSATSEAFP